MTINMKEVRKRLTTISIKLDGDKWCVLWGIDLQQGIAGFGDTPEKAMVEFCNTVLKLNNPESKLLI